MGTAGAGGSPGGYYEYEQCDDGNASDGDGCSDSCEIEPGYVCSEPSASCRQPVCGDGIIDAVFVPDGPASGAGGATGDGSSMDGGMPMASAGAGPDGYYTFEECDDGNDVSGDGCSTSCEVE